MFRADAFKQRAAQTWLWGSGELMSNTQYAFLRKEKVPSRTALQASIDTLGFDLKLHPDLDLMSDSGFSPCVLNGVPDIGFELMGGATQEILEGADEIAGDNDYCIGMIWHSSMQDCASAMIVSCALAKDFGAVISYEGEPAEPLEKLLDAARSILEEAMNEP
jgi:hypothetical protein